MLNLPVFWGKHARHISLLSIETVQRCSEEMYLSHESGIFRDRRRKQRFFVEKLSGTFSRRSGTFLPFFARLRAITLGSKPPLVTKIARTGLSTRLTLDAAEEDVNRKWNVQFLELISIMPQHRPEVATVKTRSLAASLNGGLVFLFSVQKLLFVQDFRSILLQETHLSVFSVVFSQD